MLLVYQSIILAAHIHHASHMVIKKHHKVDKWEHEGTKSLSLSLSCSLSKAALVFWDWAISLVWVSFRYISPEHFLSSLSSIPLKLRPQLPFNIQAHIMHQHNTHNKDNFFSQLGHNMNLICKPGQVYLKDHACLFSLFIYTTCMCAVICVLCLIIFRIAYCIGLYCIV